MSSGMTMNLAFGAAALLLMLVLFIVCVAMRRVDRDIEETFRR